MSEAPAANTERFQRRRQLGSGGFGTVYEAFDRKRNSVVALKTLRSASAADLYRFKQEFRAVSRLSHRNLVTLYELISEGDQWFFSMELIDGVDLLTYLRGGPASESGGLWTPTRTPDVATRDEGAWPPDEGVAQPLSHREVPIPRLVSALHELAEGLSALHAAGVVHRDIKPANVLCTADGRIVLLDFGISQEMDRGTATATVIGTPDYMSPEQTSEQRVSPATDWYSVGVLMYQALTGGLPYVGSTLQILHQKTLLDPPPPSSVVPHVPPALNELCVQLLQRQPSARPSGEEIVARLRELQAQLAEPVEARAQAVPRDRLEATFVGRERELRELAVAREAFRQGKAVAALVSGGSGLGKSTLCRRFLRELSSGDEKVVVLSGRCYEHEDVPFKALDGVIDSLSRYLRVRSEGAGRLLPRNIHALARLFPVLLQAPAVKAAPERRIADDLQARQAAFGALREMLLRLSDQSPVVLYIDDLQWGDPDGIALLMEVLRPPDPPPVLLLVSYRADEGASPAVQSLRQGLQGELGRAVVVHDIAVGELTPAESEALARTLLPEGAQAKAAAIAREAEGNAFFIAELSRALPGDSPSGAVTLDAMIRAHAEGLPEASRLLLRLVAVAGQPVSRTVTALAAYGTSSGVDEPMALSRLQSERLVRVRKTSQEDLLPYHDRIREAVLTGLEPAVLRDLHLRLARALESSGDLEPERLAYHLRAGGALRDAAQQALRAAERAAAALAYHQAVKLLRLALESEQLSSDEMRQVESRLADALAGAGRPREAAEAYLALARSQPQATLQRRRQAAGQFFAGGYIDEGKAVLLDLLPAARLAVPRTTLGVLVRALAGRLFLRLRGLGFRERPVSEVSPHDLLRIDTCEAVASVAPANPVLAMLFRVRAVRYALAAGDARRIALSLPPEAVSMFGFGASRAQADRLVKLATSLAERLGDSYAKGRAVYAAGHLAHLEGRWRESTALLERATEILQNDCVASTPQIDYIHTLLAFNRRWMGDLRQLAEHLPPLLRDAVERGQQSNEIIVQLIAGFMLPLRDDQPDRAEELIRSVEARIAGQSFNLLHLHALIARVSVLLYCGRGPEAWRVVETAQGAIDRSGTLRVELFRMVWQNLRATAALASGQPVSVTERAARQLARGRPGFAPPLATLVRALARKRRGDSSEAIALMSEAEKAFERLDMPLLAKSARLRRGQWLGGDEGEALRASAEAWMASQGIRAPTRMADMMAPDSG